MTVFILDEGIEAEVLSLMAYGAIVRYSLGGIEFNEMLADEDYLIMEEVSDE